MNDRKPGAIAEKILGKIKDEGIRPEASWKFALRKTLLWTGIALAGGFAAISLSLIIFSLFSIDQDIFGFAPKRLFSPAVFRSLPLLWIGSLLAFVTLAVFEYRETGHGYRHRPLFVALTTFLIVFGVGSILHLLRVGEQSDMALRKAIPRYDQSVRPREEFWSHPEEGFAMGTISEVTSSGFLMNTPVRNGLIIRVGEDTLIRPSAKVSKDSEVRVIGDQERDGSIDAEEILPAMPPRLRDGEKGRETHDNRPPPTRHPEKAEEDRESED